ncbi:hypothetical protein QBC33DRAFT_460525 [Phialemonium atrogriseum]|uniref:DUF3431 domain containing protein n=1 Tax=Phialemonium atrogriseum TaxID=1093897 RepID=A0AAJ0FI50_9PEZI|nr:uncharacterized protein QBC33DRAFT_460525 [Phialemonium atrogriseum]KAK1762914.1 hypothetical protein QBC33DRAFT_460525 [Phialemonium atrogriseum]
MAFGFRRGPKLSAIPVILLLFLGGVWWLTSHPFPSFQLSTPRSKGPPAVEIVVASMKHEDTRWIPRYIAEWPRQVYVVDDPHSPLTVPVNKGREAMVYLTHLIDNYDHLADTTIFIHASRFQWHNDDPDYDALPTLRHLNMSFVQEAGYTNLRCVWVLGCPVEIRPFDDELRVDQLPDGTKLATKHIFKQAFHELLPDIDVPVAVGVTCCSQFAVTKETVQRRPRADYVRFRQWLIETSLVDDLSGRVLEYSWHIIFGKPAVHCPRAQDCYCNMWGLCDLTCVDRECTGRYTLPSSATLPNGWPRIGWEGEQREYSSPIP